MDKLFITLLFIIFFTYLGFPLVLILLSIIFGKKINIDEDDLPSVSLLIAAYNEEKFIEEKILNSLELDYPREKLDIVVVSDGSIDNTDNIVKRYNFRGIQLYRVEGRVGKTQARNQAVLASRKEIIVFSDATAVFKPDAIRKLVRNFTDRNVGMVSGSLCYRDEKQSSMGRPTKVYWAYESLIKRAQSRLNTLTGSVGCINAFRRHLYHVLPANIIEDFTQPLMILSQNHRVVYEAEAVAFERTTQKPDQEFEMRVRVIRGGMKGMIYALRHLNIFKHQWILVQLFCHKGMRWLLPLFLLQLFMVNIYCFLVFAHPVYDLTMLLQFVFYFLAILGLFTKVSGTFGKLIYLPTYFLVGNAASVKALYLTLTSELEATWETNVY